jgi:hypothetical protein
MYFNVQTTTAALPLALAFVPLILIRKMLSKVGFQKQKHVGNVMIAVFVTRWAESPTVPILSTFSHCWQSC